jgi:hypothetical protein
MRTITVQDRQNIVDIAIQEYGSAASVIDLCIDNNLELDVDLEPGMTLQIQDSYPESADGDVADYLKINNIVVISMAEDDTNNVLGDNDGNFIITNDDDYIGA